MTHSTNSKEGDTTESRTLLAKATRFSDGVAVEVHDLGESYCVYIIGEDRPFSEWDRKKSTLWDVIAYLDDLNLTIRFCLNREEREELHKSLYS